MFTDYKTQVVEFYKKKRDSGNLPLNLLRPTPGKLKDECLSLFCTRTSRQDINTLRQFCEFREDQNDTGRALRAFDIDKFRPLVKFLKDQNRNTDDKNIELLAWLISFPLRPYQYGRDYTNISDVIVEPGNESKLLEELRDNEKSEIIAGGIAGNSTIVGNPGNRQSDESSTKQQVQRRFRFKRTVLVIPVGFVIVLLVFLERKAIATWIWGKQCMYWAKDHYEAVDCETKIPNITLLALDEFKYKHLKKITRPDTIHPNQINKVHYSKVNGVVEFYTTSGEHPEYPGRYLKPMTGYMYEKYVMGGKKE